MSTYRAVCGLVVETRTPITMSAGTDFVVEGAIDPKGILLALKNEEFIFKKYFDEARAQAITYLSFSVPKMEARYSAILLTIWCLC